MFTYIAVESLPTSDTSNFDGPRALPSTTGDGAYLQMNEFLYELNCSTSSCTWSLMEQKLSTRVIFAIMLYLPQEYTCLTDCASAGEMEDIDGNNQCQTTTTTTTTSNKFYKYFFKIRNIGPTSIWKCTVFTFNKNRF